MNTTTNNKNRDKNALTATFSLACFEIRSRNKRAINSTQNMRGLDHATIPIPSSHGLRKERLAQ